MRFGKEEGGQFSMGNTVGVKGGRIPRSVGSVQGKHESLFMNNFVRLNICIKFERSTAKECFSYPEHPMLWHAQSVGT